MITLLACRIEVTLSIGMPNASFRPIRTWSVLVIVIERVAKLRQSHPALSQ